MAIRKLHQQHLEADLVVTGGGLAGVCAAVTAARLGLRVILAQDRPVLGGNSSSEIRLWVLGASCFGRSHNRYAREGGVMDELYIENRFRNPEGNPVLWDAVLLEWVKREENITLLLDTAVDGVKMHSEKTNRIESVRGFSPISQTEYILSAPYFLDASGDGIVGYLSGAEYRIGRESKEKYQEKSAPEQEDKRLLGSSIYFMSKDAGRPVRFVPPAYAIDLSRTNIPKFRRISPRENGPEFWWIEYGGLLDTVHEAQSIKWELWGVVYGVWDYIKNSGKYEGTKNLTLEWVGLTPGKRESRRFIGDYVLTQTDILEARRFYDAAAAGGWPIDVHPAEGVYAKENACSQEHPAGVYTIPYRCYYSRNIDNLFLAGRLISCSHLAFGSTRVMGTCAAGGQAAGAAAYLCRQSSCMPRDLSAPENAAQLQRLLLRENQDIHWRRNDDPCNAALQAKATASSWRKLKGCVERTDQKIPLSEDLAIMLPVVEGRLDSFTIPLEVQNETTAQVSFWTNDAGPNYSPNQKLYEASIPLAKGDPVELALQPQLSLAEPHWIWFIIRANEWISAYRASDKAVGVIAKKPERPRKMHHEYDGELIWKPRKCEAAFSISPEQDCYRPQNVVNGYSRPFQTPNLWSSERFGEGNPVWIELRWEHPQRICQIDVVCNSDQDNPLETVLVQHSDCILEETLKDLHIAVQDRGGEWRILKRVRDNHHTVIRCRFDAIEAQAVKIECLAAHENFPYAEIYEIRVYSEPASFYAKAIQENRRLKKIK